MFTTAYKPRKSAISLTPLIDVVFILLVFFMLATTMLEWHSVEMDTSTAEAVAPADVEPFVVKIYDDRIVLEGKELSLDALIQSAQTRTPSNIAINLEPQGDTHVQRVINVLDALATAELSPLSLTTDPSWSHEDAAK